MNEVIDRLNEITCQKNPDKVFVFGDNLLEKGRAGQAAIRYEPNAFGIPTKVLPSMKVGSFMSDCAEHEEAVMEKLRKLYRLQKDFIIVFPIQGLGTGFAQLDVRAPKIFNKMNKIIVEHFGVDEYKKFLKME